MKSVNGGSRWSRSLGPIGPRETWNFLALIAAQLLVGLVGLTSTRLLTPVDKGLFTGVYLWSMVGQTVVGLSLPNALLFFGVAEGLSRPSRRVLAILGSTTVLCGGLLALYVAGRSPAHAALELVVVLLPAATFAFEVSTYSTLAEGGAFFAYRLAQAGAFAVLGIPLLLVTHSATFLTGALLSSYIFCVAAYVGLNRGNQLRSRPRLGLAKLARWSLKGHPGLTLSLLATRLDILFVTLFLSTLAAGLYAAAAAVPNLLAFGGTALGLSLANRATRNSQGNVPAFAARFAIALFIGNCFVALALIAIRTPLVTEVFGSPYRAAIPLVIPLTVSLPFWSLAAYEAQLLAAIGRPVHQTIGQGIAAALLAGGSAYGVAHNAVEVVAWSNVVAYLGSTLWQSAALALSRPTLVATSQTRS